MADEPIDEQDYIGGPTVVDIGDIRVSRGLTRRPVSSCSHKRMLYDTKERRVWCQDCEQDVDPFDAFTNIVSRYDQALTRLSERQQKVEEAEQKSAHLIAAKNLEKVWRSRKMLPVCPSCRHGLMPEDFKSGVETRVSREIERIRRKAEREGNT